MSERPPARERLRALRDLVGRGELMGKVEVNQVYARYQDGFGDLGDGSGDLGILTPTEESHAPGPGEYGHPGPWTGRPGVTFQHPRGGEAGFLSIGLDVIGPEIVQKLADAISEEKPMVDAMVEGMQKLADHVYDTAPREWWPLRNSASVTVYDEHVEHEHIPAIMPRLSQGELDAIRRLSIADAFDHFHDGEWQHVSHHPGLDQAALRKDRRVP